MIWVSFACLAIASFGLSIDYFFRKDLIELHIITNLIVFLIVLFDVMGILMKFRVGALLEPKHLRLYPLSKMNILFYNFLLLISDIKSLLILTSTVVFSIFYINQDQFIPVIISIYIWLFLLININLLVLILYKFTGNVLTKFRENLTLVSLFFVFVILTLSFIDSEIVYTKIPLISYAGNGLYGLIISDTFMVISNIIYMTLSFSILLIVYALLPNNY